QMQLRFTSASMLVTDEINSRGLQYAADYSANFVDRSLVDKAYVDGAVSGLEALDEGNGIGWRLIGKPPANYGDIGLDAVDLSQSSGASTTVGATGVASFAEGGYYC